MGKMMNYANKSRPIIKRTSIWQYLLLLSVLVSSVVYALPNVYGHDPSIAISLHKSSDMFPPTTKKNIQELLDTHKIVVKSAGVDNGRYLVRFHDVDTQFKAFDVLKNKLPNSHSLTYVLASRSPDWLSAIGASPMQLGLDLQGGIHLLYEVDMEEALNKAEERYMGEYRLTMQNADIRYKNIEHFNDPRH